MELAAGPGRGTWLGVEGRSSRPLFRPGDEALLVPITGRLRPLEIVAYEREGRLALHRVILVGGSGAILRGDGASSGEPVAFGRIVARAVGRRRAGRELTGGTLRWRLANAWSVTLSLLRWAAWKARSITRGRPAP